MHFAVAEAGFDSMHVEQVQLPPLALGGLIPAADQSKAIVGAGVTVPTDEFISGF